MDHTIIIGEKEIELLDSPRRYEPFNIIEQINGIYCIGFWYWLDERHPITETVCFWRVKWK